MFDEPRRHPRFLLLIALVALGTVPLPFVGQDLVLFLGLPVWIWWSLTFTALLSGLTAWGALRFWRDEDDGVE